MKSRYAVRNKLEVFYTGGPLALHPEGSVFACACSQEIKFVQNASNTILKTYPGDGELITALHFTPDGKFLFSASRSLCIKKWCLSSDQCLHTFKPHTAPVSDIDIDLSGSLVAFGSADRLVTVYDINGMYRTHTFKGHSAAVLRVLFHPTEGELLSCGVDNLIKVWNLRTSQSKTTIKGHASAVTSLAYSTDGRYFVSAGRDNVIIVWSAVNYSKIVEFPVFESVEDLVCLPTEQFQCSLLSSTTRKSKAPPLLVVAGGERGVARIWRSDDGTCLTPKQSTAMSEITSLKFLHYINQLVASREDCSIEFISLRILPTKGIEMVSENLLVGNLDEITHLEVLEEFSESDATVIAVATNSPNILLFDLNRLNCEKMLKGHTATILCLGSVKIDGQNYLLSGSKDCSLKVWDLKSCCCLCEVVGHGSAITSIDSSPKDNGIVVSASSDKLLKLWRVATNRKELKQISGVVAHTKDINCVDISPHDRFVATGSMDKAIKIFQLPSLVLEMTLLGHSRGIWSVEFSKVEKIVVSSSADMTVKIWSLVDGSCLKTFEGHSGSVMEAHFLSNSAQVVSCGGDGLIKVWNLGNCENTATFDEHEDRVWSLVFFGSQQQIMVSGGSDSQLIVWEDITDKDKESEIKTKQIETIAEQQLHNALRVKNYSLAVQLAFSLNRPRYLLNVLRTNAMEQSDHIAYSTILDCLVDDDTVAKCMQYIRDWNTSARNYEEAQRLLQIIFERLPPKRLSKIPGLDSILEAVESFTEKHTQRLQKFHQSSFVVDFTMNSFDFYKDN